MHNHLYENEFNLHVNEISFSYEKMGTKTRFEEEAKGNSEMAYWEKVFFLLLIYVKHMYTGHHNNAKINFIFTTSGNTHRFIQNGRDW